MSARERGERIDSGTGFSKALAKMCHGQRTIEREQRETKPFSVFSFIILSFRACALRAQGGSTSVPKEGGYSLGLSWEVVSREQMELQAYISRIENSKAIKRRYPSYSCKEELLPPLPEDKRYQILKKSCGEKELDSEETVENSRIRISR